MKNLQELIDNLNNLPDALSDFMPTEIEVAAKDFIALKVTSIRRFGLTNKPTYSTKPGVPAFLLKGKNGDYPAALNEAGRALIDKRIKAKRTKSNIYANFINHRDLRNAQGLQTGFVDLSYSNEMLNNIQVISKQNARVIYRANIGCTSAKAVIKFGANHKRYGDFFQPDQNIRRIVGNASALRTGQFINSKINGIVKITVNE